MLEEKPVQLILQVRIEDSDSEELDFQTRQLLSEIYDQDVESAELVSGPPEEGSKALGAAEIGSIAVSLGPVVLPALIETVSAWVGRGKGRNVKFKGEIEGKIVEFEGSTNDFERILKLLKQSGG